MIFRARLPDGGKIAFNADNWHRKTLESGLILKKETENSGTVTVLKDREFCYRFASKIAYGRKSHISRQRESIDFRWNFQIRQTNPVLQRLLELQ